MDVEHTVAVFVLNMAEICIARGMEARARGLAASFCPERNVELVPRAEVNAAVCIVDVAAVAMISEDTRLSVCCGTAWGLLHFVKHLIADVRL